MVKPSLPDQVKEQVVSVLKKHQPHVQAEDAVRFLPHAAFSVSFIGLSEVDQTELHLHLTSHFKNNIITVTTRASDTSHSFKLTVKVEKTVSCCGFPLFWLRFLLLFAMSYWFLFAGIEFAKNTGINPLVVSVLYLVLSMGMSGNLSST